MMYIPLFGLNIKDTTLDEAGASIVADAKQNNRCKVFFLNAHCVNVAANNASYLQALQDQALLYGDGSGMRYAAKLAGFWLRDNVNGTDLFPIICREAAREQVSLALLGARPGIAQRCADNMKKQFPHLNIVWTHDGYFNPNDAESIIQSINNSGAQILLIAMGVPNQELWIARHAEKLQAPILMGVGALFDFYSGIMPRAPYFIRKLGLEWVFRLMMEPKRMFARYVLGNPIFMMRVLWRRLKGRKALQQQPLIHNVQQSLNKFN